MVENLVLPAPFAREGEYEQDWQSIVQRMLKVIRSR